MGYTLDYFVAELCCQKCERVSEADDATNMATYIRSEPELAYLGVGDTLIVSHEAMRDRGYLTVKVPEQNEPIHILHPWECPFCGQGNWADIIVHDSKIENIVSVTLDSDTIKRAHFIHDESKGIAAILTNTTYAEIGDTEVVPILKKIL